MKRKFILLPITLTALAPTISMVGCGGGETPPEPEVQDFEKDSWENVCNYANQGLDALANHYGLKPLDFVGKKRYVKLNGLDHEVIVVGVNQDTYTDKDGINHYAALTFQFNNLISDSQGHAITTKWDKTDNSNYWESTLYKTLNDEQDQSINSVYEMIKEKNNWATNIKEVYRSVYTGNPTDGWILTTKTEKLFEPNLSSLFSSKGIEDSQGPFVSYRQWYKLESVQYQYYALSNNIGNSPVYVDSWVPFQCLYRDDFSEHEFPYTYALSSLQLMGTYQTYGVQSISLDNTIMIIQNGGGMISDCTLAPLFCI